MNWEVEFYEVKKGDIPVMKFLENLPSRERAKAIWVIDLLEKTGINLGKPHARHIEGPLWELRPQNNRILYFLDKKTFVFLHGFRKKGRKLPRVEKEIALQRMEDYLERR